VGKQDVVDFTTSTLEFNNISFVAPPGVDPEKVKPTPSRSAMLAFDSDLKSPTSEIARFARAVDATGQPQLCSGLCVLGRGFWMLRRDANKNTRWHRYNSDDPTEQLACLVTVMSATIFKAHQERALISGGVGMFISHDFKIDDLAGP
jgi:hypothetical protein